MTPLASRFAGPLILLLALALLGVHLRGDARLDADDCARPELLRETGRIDRSAAGGERTDLPGGWLQWSSGVVLAERLGHDLDFLVLRSFDPPNLYRGPTRFVDPPLEVDRQLLRRVAAGDRELPVYVRYDYERQGVRLAAYLFVYGGRPVAHPFVAQLVSGPAQVFTGTRPMTLFLVSGRAPTGRVGAAEKRARTWLAAAWQHYRAACDERGGGD